MKYFKPGINLIPKKGNVKYAMLFFFTPTPCMSGTMRKNGSVGCTFLNDNFMWEWSAVELIPWDGIT